MTEHDDEEMVKSKLWSEFNDARDKAQQSGQIEDGVEAGRAWSRWLREFCQDSATKTAVHGNVVSWP